MSSPVAEVLADLGHACDRLGARWYLFGAQAAILYGSGRLTADVDATLEPKGLPAARIVDALEGAGFVLRVARDSDFVTQTRVLPLAHGRTGLVVDVVLAGPGIEELFLERAVQLNVAGVAVPVACAEDLIVMKLLAGRPKDLEDVKAIVAARRHALDEGMVRQTLGLLEQALGQSDLSPIWERLWCGAEKRQKPRAAPKRGGSSRRWK